jgi:GDP-D-mannose 3', 5'-epimerase
MSSKPMTGKAALVCGAGGFIGHHLVKRLKRESFWVRGADLKFPRFSETEADDFMVGDLRDPYFVQHVIDRRFSEIYQLAADMGGAGYIFTGEHDADVMHNSASINLNILHAAHARNNKRIFYSSSLSRVQPARPRQSELRGGKFVSGRARQRVRMGEAF